MIKNHEALYARLRTLALDPATPAYITNRLPMSLLTAPSLPVLDDGPHNDRLRAAVADQLIFAANAIEPTHYGVLGEVMRDEAPTAWTNVMGEMLRDVRRV